MEHGALLGELVLILVVGLAVAVVLARLRLPTAAGLLLSGALIGPSGFGLVRSVSEIETIAELGVVLLLFTIGIEMSTRRLGRLGPFVLLGGGLQVGLTTALAAVVALAAGAGLRRAIFYGFLFALSSTAIVLRLVSDRGELESPHGRFVVGVLVLQDLCVVPMLLVVPLLGHGGGAVWVPLLVALLEAAGLVVLALLAARFVVPKLLSWVDATRSRDAFLLAVLALCLGTAWLASLAGLSLALGAFLGGLIVADTHYGPRATTEVLPLRDAFTSLFFVSLGMLFDVHAIAAHPLLVALLAVGFVVGKGLVAMLVALVAGLSPRAALLSGVALGQFGEFSFVLVSAGVAAGVASATALRPLLAAGIVSMFLAPLLVALGPRIARAERWLAPLARLIGRQGGRRIEEAGEEVREGHVVLAGYGLAGQRVARALAEARIPYVVLELNATTVRAARARGEPIVYADASSPDALAKAGAAKARAVLVQINDADATRRAVAALRRIAPETTVLVRARHATDRPWLTTLGATDVVVDEEQAARESLTWVLRLYGLPDGPEDGDRRAGLLGGAEKRTPPHASP